MEPWSQPLRIELAVNDGTMDMFFRNMVWVEVVAYGEFGHPVARVAKTFALFVAAERWDRIETELTAVARKLAGWADTDEYDIVRVPSRVDQIRSALEDAAAGIESVSDGRITMAVDEDDGEPRLRWNA